jgi:hypothetical protein
VVGVWIPGPRQQADLGVGEQGAEPFDEFVAVLRQVLVRQTEPAYAYVPKALGPKGLLQFAQAGVSSPPRAA